MENCILAAVKGNSMSKILKCHPGIGDNTEGIVYVPKIIFLLVMIWIGLKVCFLGHTQIIW